MITVSPAPGVTAPAPTLPGLGQIPTYSIARAQEGASSLRRLWDTNFEKLRARLTPEEFSVFKEEVEGAINSAVSLVARGPIVGEPIEIYSAHLQGAADRIARVKRKLLSYMEREPFPTGAEMPPPEFMAEPAPTRPPPPTVPSVPTTGPVVVQRAGLDVPWGAVALGAVGVLALGWVGYKVLGKKRRR